ncbi:hypothetical protein O6H91_17G000800 [Diphasiastrum complanatum]|uniref:Uncharacterized protein n=1 Tax=Diphasiastrum complanatum TaxID=34168 RepID=A0ACC2B4H0_DIPCM|nr:hypothetical protein O6H91_17G000800 [Diphasiastrum complanatum]
MTEAFLTSLSIENPSTLLSIDTGNHDEIPACRQVEADGPPDINLPLSDELHPSCQWFSSKEIEALDVSLAPPVGEPGSSSPVPKGRRLVRRSDTIWGAWFFFNHYFRASLKDKGQAKLSGEGLLQSELDNKCDLRLDVFLVQHDMENMYMWVFKERPENALGKMQLRSYMNGHSRFGEPQFPFSVEKGFARSHRMQRKHYKGLSNPQCIHGIEVIRSPNLNFLSEDCRKRWIELTGRDLSFSLPPDAEAFSEWRSLPSPDHDLDSLSLPLQSKPCNGSLKKLSSSSSSRISEKANGPSLNLSTLLSSQFTDNLSSSGKKRKTISSLGQDLDNTVPILNFTGEPIDLESEQGGRASWKLSFSGMMTEASGPVTGAKSIYEDEEGYLIMVSLPFTDMHRLRVSWRNTATHGVVKIHCTSIAGMPFVTRGDRTFKLTDPNPEHCPPGEFVREIELATRIPENAELKAFYVEASAGLEIMVPKHHNSSEEREVRVYLPPQLAQSAHMFRKPGAKVSSPGDSVSGECLVTKYMLKDWLEEI